MKEKLIVGSIELCDLPEIGVEDLKIRVDTGAKTSSLHVDNLKQIIKNGKPWVRFDIHPDSHNIDSVKTCEAPLHDIRSIKSSNGASEERLVVRTKFRIAQQEWMIEITLTDRSGMSYLMLLGREAMGDKMLVDPSQSFLTHTDD